MKNRERNLKNLCSIFTQTVETLDTVRTNSEPPRPRATVAEGQFLHGAKRRGLVRSP